MGEFNEQLLPTSCLREDMDYIALGHFHCYTRVTEDCYYAGSTERMTFGEAGQDKGYVLVDLERKATEFKKVKIRPMIDLPVIDAKGLDIAELTSQVRRRLESVDLGEAIVRLNVRNITGALYRSLDHITIRSLASDAAHFEPRFEMTTEDVSVQSHDVSLTALDQEFVSFLERYPVEGVPKDVVLEKGLDYLRRGLAPSD
jgi:exonuclease SbcD